MRRNPENWPLRHNSRKIAFIRIAGTIIVGLIFTAFVIFFIIPSNKRIDQFHQEIIERQKTLDKICHENQRLVCESRNHKLALDTILQRRLEFIEKQQADVLADLRQENNNYIEHVNTWLGVWIAILALACGVAPALLQYRLYIINREKLREELDEFEIILANHEIGNYVTSMTECMESQVVSDSKVSDKLIKIFTHRAIYGFEKIVNLIDDQKCNKLSPKNQENLLIALIQLSALLDKLKIKATVNSIDALDGCIYSIRGIIEKMIDTEHSDMTDMHAIHKELIPLLHKLISVPVILDFKS